MLEIGGVRLSSRLLTGTGKYASNDLIPKILESTGSKVITVAVRRVDLSEPKQNLLNFIPKDIQLLPNTSGAKTAEEAVRIARLAKAMGCGNWIKIEVIRDNKYLLPDNIETIKATEILANEGFTVLPYMNPDLMVARALVDAGAATVMPLGSPIGSNRGIKTEELIRIIIDEINIPVIVDAGIGRPSDAAYAMEMGADAVLVNTAIATADDPVKMGRAFALAVEAGRLSYESKAGRVLQHGEASSPLTGFLGA